jgi:hypothetical protein
MESLHQQKSKLAHRVAAVAAAIVLLGAQALAQNPALAQNFEQLPFGTFNGRTIQTWPGLPNPSSAEAKAITDMLSGQGFDEAKFNQFFNELVFPLFAQWQEIKLGGKNYSPFIDTPSVHSPPKMRAAFRRDFIAKATNAAAREKLNALTLAKMDQIASGNFHPVCRANAMIMIATLSEADPDTAWKKALPALLKGATAPTTIDAVRVPALAGLVRQAKTGIDAEAQPQIITPMLALIKMRAPTGEPTDGPDWIVRRAIDVLATIGSPGVNGAVPTALVATVEDKTASMTVRAAAAAALAKIRFTPPAGFNAKPWIEALSKLAVESYKTELNTAASQRVPIVPERLKAQLTDIRQGLAGADGNGGLLALAAAPDKDGVKQIILQIDNVMKATGTPAAPAVAPVPVPGAAGGLFLPQPPDPMKPVVDAITKAGGELEGVVQRGGAPAVVPAVNPGPVRGVAPAPGPTPPANDPF